MHDRAVRVASRKTPTQSATRCRSSPSRFARSGRSRITASYLARPPLPPLSPLLRVDNRPASPPASSQHSAHLFFAPRHLQNQKLHSPSLTSSSLRCFAVIPTTARPPAPTPPIPRVITLFTYCSHNLDVRFRASIACIWDSYPLLGVPVTDHDHPTAFPPFAAFPPGDLAITHTPARSARHGQQGQIPVGLYQRSAPGL